MKASIYFVNLLVSLISSQCFDSPSILSPNQGLRPIDCNNPDSETRLLQQQSFDLTGGNDARSTLGSQGMSKDGKIQINLSCAADDKTCGMVLDTFVTASDYLTNIIKFKNPIKIEARFFSFCRTEGDCDKIRLTLGKASATRYHQLIGDDGKVRLYPQALVKQLNNASSKTAYHPSDIVAEFNSDAPFYFQSQGGQISKIQSDFLLVISHELVHGLGFATLYNDYLSETSAQALFPNPEIISATRGGKTRINQFLESIFDRYVVFTDGKKTLSSVTDVLNTYVSDNKNNFFATDNDAYRDFMKSSQYQVARDLLKTATTAGTMEFVFNTTTKVPFNSLTLETNIKPYAPSSSVSHVSLDKYKNSKEFLMRPVMSAGSSLASLVAAVGSGGWDTAPYGPGLIAMLETMGYPTNENPNPNVIAGPVPGSKDSYGNFGQKSVKFSWALLSSIGLLYFVI